MVGVHSGHSLEAPFHLKNNNVLNLRGLPSFPTKAPQSLYIALTLTPSLCVSYVIGNDLWCTLNGHFPLHAQANSPALVHPPSWHVVDLGGTLAVMATPRVALASWLYIIVCCLDVVNR